MLPVVFQLVDGGARFFSLCGPVCSRSSPSATARWTPRSWCPSALTGVGRQFLDVPVRVGQRTALDATPRSCPLPRSPIMTRLTRSWPLQALWCGGGVRRRTAADLAVVRAELLGAFLLPVSSRRGSSSYLARSLAVRWPGAFTAARLGRIDEASPVTYRFRYVTLSHMLNTARPTAYRDAVADLLLEMAAYTGPRTGQSGKVLTERSAERELIEALRSRHLSGTVSRLAGLAGLPQSRIRHT